MNGGCSQWLARTLATAVLLIAASAAASQEPEGPSALANGGPDGVAQREFFRRPAGPARLTSAETENPAPHLGAEIDELKAEIKRMKAGEAEARKKAASAPSFRPFARIFWDTATFSQNAASLAQAAAAGESYNGAEFRNARIGLAGDAFRTIDYKIEMDFAGSTAFKDVYVQVKNLPRVQNVRAGHYYEPFGLETQTGTANTTFMEKSLINELGGIGGYKSGVMAFGSTENRRLFWEIGANEALGKDSPPVTPFDSRTGNKDDFNGGLGKFGLYDDRGGYALSMRMAGLPWWDEPSEGRGLLQTGLSYTYREIPALVPVNGQSQRFRLRAQPESHLAGYVVDTGWLDDTDRVNALGPELLFVLGPFSLQSEYLWLWLDRSEHPGAAFDGGYLYVSYFLTGESRAVGRDGILKPCRNKPFENFFRARAEGGSITTGKGAWELAYRCSYVNLASAGVDGGRVVDHAAGANWYLNPFTRFMLNYVHSEAGDRPTATGVLDALMTRVQIDF